jgi:hypothetical protein
MSHHGYVSPLHGDGMHDNLIKRLPNLFWLVSHLEHELVYELYPLFTINEGGIYLSCSRALDTMATKVDFFEMMKVIKNMCSHQSINEFVVALGKLWSGELG